MGAWVTYGLGSENENLPAFVAIPDPRGTPQSSVNNWGPGFLPAVFQGTPFNAASPIRKLMDVFDAGDLEAAEAIQARLVMPNQAVTSSYGVAGLKAALDSVGMYGGPVRSPLTPLKREDRRSLEAILADAELL